MSNENYDLTVIGSGPGGYVAAIRASQLGMRVSVVERNEFGGICLNWGCIPTKALLKSAEVFHTAKRFKEFGIQAENITFDFQQIIKRSRRTSLRLSKGVEYLFKKNNITSFKGFGKLASKNEVSVYNEQGEQTNTIQTDKILIATGARPRAIPNIHFDGKKIISSKDAMILDEIPKSMIVIGAGAIGVEFAYFYNTFGCKIDLVEMLPTILPVEDNEITEIVTKSFKKNKISIHTKTMVKEIKDTDTGVSVIISKDGEEKTLEADVALVAIGVQGNYENMGLERLGIEIEKSWIKVNKNYQTNIDNIYAIGDIIGPPWLAHVASAEGISASEQIAGSDVESLNYNNIPGCTYCQPQVASIGLTEEKALKEGYQLKTGKFPFQANGKSLALGESIGLVKLIFDADTAFLLGAHIVHSEATELINELSVIKANKMKGHDIINAIHAHPTLSEAIIEAVEDAYGKAIHI